MRPQIAQWLETLLASATARVTEQLVALAATLFLLLTVLATSLALLNRPDALAMNPRWLLLFVPVLFVCLLGIWRRQHWAGPTIALSTAALVGLFIPEPFVTQYIAVGALFPPMIAILVARFWWMPVAQVVSITVLLWRAEFQGVYTDPLALILIGAIVGCLCVNRGLVELSNRRREAALRELQHINETLDHTVQIRTADLEAKRDKYKALVEQQRKFYRQVSHDLRGDLSRITSSMDFIFEAYRAGNAEEVQANWRRLTRWVRRINSLAGDLLDVAVLDRLQLRPDIVSFGDVLKPIVDEMQVDAELYRVELLLGSVAHLPLVWCDSDRISRVLRNLIGNAIKYTYGVGDHVRVDAIALDDVVVCSVVDDGPGIEPWELARLGEEFVRLSDNGTGPVGTGIGLSLCRHLVRASGGTFTMSSAGEGAGTIVTFTVPIYNGQDETSQPAAELHP